MFIIDSIVLIASPSVCGRNTETPVRCVSDCGRRDCECPHQQTIWLLNKHAKALTADAWLIDGPNSVYVCTHCPKVFRKFSLGYGRVDAVCTTAVQMRMVPPSCGCTAFRNSGVDLPEF